MLHSGFMTTLFRSALVAAGLLVSHAAHAQKASCPTPMGDRADRAADRVADWSGLTAWYRDYADCDDGETSDGLDNKVAQLFANRWDDLMRVAPRFERSAGLRRFLLRHISVVGMSADQAAGLAQRAKTNCTTGNTALCRDIASEAEATVKEATQ